MLLKRCIITIAVTLLITTPLFAQFSKIAQTGAQWLKIWPEPRGVGMGGACVATATDAGAIYWNPAGLGLARTNSFIATDVEWFADTRINFLSFAYPYGGIGAFGISFLTFSTGSELITTEQDQDGASGLKWNAGGLVIGLTYAKMLTDKFSFGVTGKLIQESIWDMTSNGFAVDMGAFFRPGYWGSMRFGFTIKNFGPDMRFTGGQLEDALWRPDQPGGTAPIDVEYIASPYHLPTSLNIGVAYDIIDLPAQRMTATAELLHPVDGVEKICVGLEYTYGDVLAIRGGYEHDPDVEDRDDKPVTERMTAGAGFKYAGFKVDYAFQDMGVFGLGHRVSIGMDF